MSELALSADELCCEAAVVDDSPIYEPEQKVVACAVLQSAASIVAALDRVVEELREHRLGHLRRGQP